MYFPLKLAVLAPGIHIAGLAGLESIMATCTTQTLMDEAGCYACLDLQSLMAVQTSLLCRVAIALGAMATCDPQTLVTNAKCFACLTPQQLQIIQTQLLCEISENISGGGGGVGSVLCHDHNPDDVADAPTTTCASVLQDRQWSCLVLERCFMDTSYRSMKILALLTTSALLCLSVIAQAPVQRNPWSTNITGNHVLGQNNLIVTNIGSGTNWVYYGVLTNTVARLIDITNVTGKYVLRSGDFMYGALQITNSAGAGGLSFAVNTNSLVCTNQNVGIGTNTPAGKRTILGNQTGKALEINNTQLF